MLTLSQPHKCALLVCVPALIYCNFLREVGLGGLRREGSKDLTLGEYIRMGEPPFH